MEPDAFQRYLDERYLPEVRWYDDRARKNRAWYVPLQWVVILLSVGAPIMVAIGVSWARWAGISMSAGVAVLTAGLKTFRFDENWLNFRTTCETLKKEQYLHGARAGQYRSAADPEALFVERVESLISCEHTAWVTTHTQKNKQGTGDREASTETTTLP